MEIKTGTFNFPPGTGERTARLSFAFPQPIAEAHVALSGYRAEFIKADRQIQRLVVRLSTEIGGRVEDGWVATVVARFNLRDQNEEHAFSGAIDFLLFAEIQEFALTPQVPAALEGPDERRSHPDQAVYDVEQADVPAGGDTGPVAEGNYKIEEGDDAQPPTEDDGEAGRADEAEPASEGNEDSEAADDHESKAIDVAEAAEEEEGE